METFQTSFIPKKPLVATQVADNIPRTRTSFIMFIAMLILISTCLATIFLYFYKGSLIKKVAGLQDQILLAKGDFDTNSISELQVFDKRMNASNQVLSTHIIFSPVFELLSSLTISSIQFTKFNVELNVDGSSYVAHLTGLARDYKSIALQAEVLNSNQGKYFKDVVFSNLVLQNDKVNKGYVGFDISFTIDPALLAYDRSILTTNTAKTL